MLAAVLRRSLQGAEPSVALLPALLARNYAAQAGPSAGAANKLGIPGVQHIVPVASGKGGVGKSTTAGRCRRPGVAL